MKILVYGIVSMFLFTSLAALPIAAIKTDIPDLLNNIKQVKTNDEDLPDLTIEIEFEYRYWEGKHFGSVRIYNIGNVEIPTGEYIVWSWGYSDGNILTNAALYLQKPLKPQSSISGDIWIPFSIADGGLELTAVVDPLAGEGYPFPDLEPTLEYGLIVEEDETENNVDTAIIPTAKSITQINLLNSLFTRFPLLQRIFRSL